MPSWRPDPDFKITISGVDYINDLAATLQIVRPENNVSRAILVVDDYKSKSYVGIFDAFSTVDVSLRYGSDSWTKVFGGIITTAAPRMSLQGEVLEVGAWGQGLATVKTHTKTTYGVESENPTKATPNQITEDIVDERVNKTFGGAATGWALTHTECENMHAGLSVTHLPGMYQNNFVTVNRVCDLANAYAQGLGPPQVSVHWHVDPAANLYMKKIDADHAKVGGTAYDWDQYWGGSQAAGTLEVKKDMVLYDFRKNVEEYANRIILCTDFRKPGYDYWTEDADTNGLWDETDVDLTLTDDAVNYVVGADSLQFEAGANSLATGFTPTAAANWNFDDIGSTDNPPTINFFARRTGNANSAVLLHLYTTRNVDYFSIALYHTATDTKWMPVASEWYGITIPIGTYYKNADMPDKQWNRVGNPDWQDIDGIQIYFNNTGFAGANQFWLDDLHLKGKIVREAIDAGEVAAHNDYQRIIRNDTAIDDTMKAGTPGTTDTGTAAMLAYAELLRRGQTPIVGMIQIPLAVDVLPGQTVHIHACKQHGGGVCGVCGEPGTFRIAQDMRIKELTHVIGPDFHTILNLTSDVTNTHAFGAPTALSLLMEYAGALGHAEARDLKGGGLDPLIPLLSESY